MKLRILTLGLASALLAACGGGGTGGAQDSKVLNVYNYSDYIAEDTIPNFEKQSGTKVTYDVFDSDEMSKPSCWPATAATTWWCPR